MSERTEALGSSGPPNNGAEERDLTGKVFGDFRILRRLGQGGMGQVYLAEQVSLKRHVALKFLKPELASNKTSLERFKREAEAVAKTSHANIVQIYSIGEAEGMHYMALEYVEGRNLREYIEKKGPPEVQMGLRIMSQVGLALQQASELGIVHRDIKPENILINRKGEVKVTDFGLNRDSKKDSSLTESRIAMGTPLYMSPEQVEGRPVDHRTDLYSFGVTCYHLFAGHPPFRGQTPFEVALQHVQKELRPLAEIRPDLPADLCNLVHRLMAKRPEQRYQTGREVVRDLGRLRDALVATGGSLPTPVLTGLTPSGTLMNLGSSEVETLSGPMPGRARAAGPRRRLVVLLLAALSAGGAIGWVLIPPPTVVAPTPAGPPEGKGGEVPPAVLELFSAAEREKDLAKRAHEAIKSANPVDVRQGLEPIMDLGVLYLRERKLDEADLFFKELERPDRRMPQYTLLSQLGRAMVLAFRDRPAESNELFVTTLDILDRLEKKVDNLPGKVFDKKDKSARALLPFWRHHAGSREVLALERNHANAPAAFPAHPRLEELRRPPVPNLKAAAGVP